jgi:ubiquinone/menaquinone biosynthesis C-methylase UbiE
MASSVAESGEEVVAEERDVMSGYDAAAPTFEHHRALPDGVPRAVRAAVLGALATQAPRLLDLGAGTGRFGRPFVAAGDAYVGVDRSFGMLREFAGHGEMGRPAPRLAQADGERLPFADATFDAVLMIHVFGGMRGWRRVLGETRRVLRARGAIVIGRSVAPDGGVDARMKQRLQQLLAERGVDAGTPNRRGDALRDLASAAQSHARVVAARWSAARTPRGFLDRHRTGARFSALPAQVRGEALRMLTDWAAATFGSLDAASSEPCTFELDVFTFASEAIH